MLHQLAEMGDQLFSECPVEREKPDPVDAELQIAVLAFDGPLADQFFLFAFGDLIQEKPDDPIGGLGFKIAGFAFGKRSGKDAQK